MKKIISVLTKIMPFFILLAFGASIASFRFVYTQMYSDVGFWAVIGSFIIEFTSMTLFVCINNKEKAITKTAITASVGTAALVGTVVICVKLLDAVHIQTVAAVCAVAGVITVIPFLTYILKKDRTKKLLAPAVLAGVVSGCIAGLPALFSADKENYFDTTEMVNFSWDDKIFSVGAGTTNNGVDKESDFINSLICIVPTQVQYNHLKNEYYNFVHFGLNTFANNEWGERDENGIGLYTITDKSSKHYVDFSPEKIDTDQWCRAFKESGSSGIIFTAKHHDGFCLWDTDTTDFKVTETEWGKKRIAEGKCADIVEMLAESCKKFDLPLGLYLSPWDMSEGSKWGTAAYGDYYRAQLEELTTKYGELFCMWFDGAVDDRVKTEEGFGYNFEEYNEIIHKNQKNCVSANAGGEVRWVGNESGVARDIEWSVISSGDNNIEQIIAASQSSEADAKRLNSIAENNENLGDRSRMALFSSGCFSQAEADTSLMRTGWFSHNTDVAKPLIWLYNTYFKTVGRNCYLLLNVGANKNGLIPNEGVQMLKKLGETAAARTRNPIKYTSLVGTYNGNAVQLTQNNKLQTALSDSYSTYNTDFDYSAGKFDYSDNSSYMLSDSEYIIDLDFEGEKSFSTILLREDLRYSQRVEMFDVYAKNTDGSFTLISKQNIIGNNRTILFKEPITAVGIRILIKQSRSNAVIDFIGVYE